MNPKNIFASILLTVTTSSFSVAQQNDSSLAKVNKRINKFAFLWSEPVGSYNVAFTFKNSIQYINCLSPQQIIDNSIKNATTEANKLGKAYDGLIVGTLGVDTAILFSDKTQDNSLASVKSINGKFLFAECKPLMNYDIVDKIDISENKNNCFTHQERIDKLLKKADKSKKDYDALVYGISGSILIKFKK